MRLSAAIVALLASTRAIALPVNPPAGTDNTNVVQELKASADVSLEHNKLTKRLWPLLLLGIPPVATAGLLIAGELSDDNDD
jgi:hypothetical protein